MSGHKLSLDRAISKLRQGYCRQRGLSSKWWRCGASLALLSRQGFVMCGITPSCRHHHVGVIIERDMVRVKVIGKKSWPWGDRLIYGMLAQPWPHFWEPLRKIMRAMKKDASLWGDDAIAVILPRCFALWWFSGPGKLKMWSDWLSCTLTIEIRLQI